MGSPISDVVSADPTIVAVLFGPGIPNALTMQGLSVGGPISVTITYTDTTTRVLCVARPLSRC
jgi:hypothetical protein